VGGVRLTLASELMRLEAARYGESVVGSEIVGLVLISMIVETTHHYLGLALRTSKYWKRSCENKDSQRSCFLASLDQMCR